MSQSEILFLLFCSITAAGAIALVVGIRGRRVGTHLHCRYCNYDLHNMPLDARQCPECGRLIHYGTPRGRLEPRRRVVRTGAAVLSLGLLGIAVVTIPSVRWIQLLPLSYLTEAIRAAPASPSTSARLGEVARRIAVSSLSQAKLDDVVELLLKIQNDPQRQWNPDIGNMIEWLDQKGKLSPAQWSAYLSHIADGRVAEFRLPKPPGVSGGRPRRPSTTAD